MAAGASDNKQAVVEICYRPDTIVNVTGGFKDRVKAIRGGEGAEGRLSPHVCAELPLERWSEAYDLLADCKAAGTAVIRLRHLTTALRRPSPNGERKLSTQAHR